MRSIPTVQCFLAVLTVGLCGVGCAHRTYSPYGYGNPYGPSYAPAYAAPQYIGPGTGPTYVPQNVPQSSGSPTPITNPPTNNNPPNWRTPTNPPSNDAPPFINDPNKTVPPGRDPIDELNNAAPGASLPTTNTNTAKLPVYERGGLADAAPPVIADIVQPVAGTEADPFFETPSRLPANPEATPMGVPEPDRTPYQYDGQSYKWLKGTVDYDDKTQTWSIIYNLTPDASDKYGGSFVISPHPDLASFQIGDIALLEGVIDPKQLDASGKPIYTITKVTGPLLPPSK
ncbi:MAG: hypothetical protein Q8K78_14355 [Planctomycetaceae bacterium]|nr:hypothetical protein [Planctomycetaceae bacterium]